MKKVDYEQFNKELKELMDKHGVAELRVTQQISIIPQMETAEETPTEETPTEEAPTEEAPTEETK